MTIIPKPNPPGGDEEIDYSWDAVKTSASDLSQRLRLFIKKIPGEFLDAVDDYICETT